MIIYHKASEWDDDAIPLYYELQLRFYLAVADVNIGSFSAVWGNNPDNDLAIPDITRDKAKEDMIFERLDEWIWSLKHDKPPTMSGVAPQLALESLARIYGASKSGLPTIEFTAKYENALRRIALLQGKISECTQEIKTYEKEIEAHSVRIAEVMREHEHGVLTTTTDKLLIDFVTKSTTRPDSKVLKERYQAIVNFSTAISTLVAQETGVENKEAAKKIFKLGTVVMSFMSLILTAVIVLTGRSLLSMFGLKSESVNIGVSFFRSIAIFYLVYGLSMSIKGYLEGKADMLFSGTIGVCSRAVRILCSYLFKDVFGNMVIAYAEAFSWMFLLAVYFYRYRKKADFKLRRPGSCLSHPSGSS